MDPRTLQKARQAGREFEDLFEKMARFDGLLVRKIPLSCKAYQDRQGMTRYHPIDSELDWQVLDRNGRIAFLDTKSFHGERFPISAFEEHQVTLAQTLNEWGHVAGFCIWFRKYNIVVFFTGAQVAALEEGSLGPEEGLHLGSGFDFNISKIFR